MIVIDGSYGEGGGQILRSAVALSVITRKPIEVRNIRAKRSNPGLRPQHVAAIKILAKISDAEVHNLEVGSRIIRFIPKQVNVKNIRFDIGTAGSITLVLQSLIPAISLSNNHAEIELVGGTDVKWSPTIDYFRYVLRDAYKAIGIEFDLEVIKRGYYPKGGGIVKCIIKPARLKAAEFTSDYRPEPKIVSICSMLPKHVAERQIAAALARLEKEGIICNKYSLSLARSLSAGSSILVYSASDYGVYIGGDAIGEKGKPAEKVGQEAAEKFLKPYNSNASIDKYLADMLVLPLSLADSRSRFIVNEMSKHLETNLYIVKSIVNCRYSIDKHDNNYMVSIN